MGQKEVPGGGWQGRRPRQRRKAGCSRGVGTRAQSKPQRGTVRQAHRQSRRRKKKHRDAQKKEEVLRAGPGSRGAIPHTRTLDPCGNRVAPSQPGSNPRPTWSDARTGPVTEDDGLRKQKGVGGRGE